MDASAHKDLSTSARAGFHNNMSEAVRADFPTVADIEAYWSELFPPQWAADWDKNGLICGDRTDVVERVLIATDPVADVVDEALERDVQLVITHHPLLLRGGSFFPADDPKGNVLHRLIQADCALLNSHTNADVAPDGVAHALGTLIGLENATPLVPAAGASDDDGDDDSQIGYGRIGQVPEQTLREFAQFVAGRLPASPHGLLVGGELDDTISIVAVSGGAGDSFLDDARAAGADVFITADLRHHPASEHLQNGKPYLLAGSHWATESPWVAWAQMLLQAEFPQVEVFASTLITEPWSAHFATTGGYPKLEVDPQRDV